MPRILSSLFALAFFVVFGPVASAQWTPEKPGSDNITIESHLPLGGAESVADIELEQEMSRPYAYVARAHYLEYLAMGMDIIDLSDPSRANVIYRWRIENEELHVGVGGLDIKYFKYGDHYYVVLSTQFRQGPDHDLGAVIFDVTGLPDPSSVHEVARIREPDLPGGFHNIFIYQHSNGRPLLFTTVSGATAHVYDLGLIVEGDRSNALVGEVPVPEANPRRAYHDFYVGYDEATETDRFYGGGSGGYYVYDVSDLQNPKLLVTLTGINGVRYGHTFTPSPDGRYVVAETEYQYAPLRIFDLKPALDGEKTNIRTPISAWTADWKNLAHNHEIRWPYVFVSAYMDGLQVFSLMDPKNPQTVAYFDTYSGPQIEEGGAGVMNGAFGVDVRNEDGLIVVSDLMTGFWAFRMEGFNGWNGEDWGVPDRSSVQKWDEKPKEGTH